jgi:hypothetical protein
MNNAFLLPGYTTKCTTSNLVRDSFDVMHPAVFSLLILSTPELNPSAQRCLPIFLLGILIFKGLTARRLYKSSGVKGLMTRPDDVRMKGRNT